MKFLLPLAAVLVMTGCKPDEPTREEPKPETKAQLREVKIEQAKLLNKKFTLEKQLNKLIANSKVDSGGALKVVMEERQQALSDLQNIRRTHPSLQKLNKELSFWQSNQQAASRFHRDSEVEEASKKIVEISGKLHNLSKELPAIREAEDRIARSGKQTASLRRELAGKTPEGQALIKQLQEIEEELAASR
ncbi:MAG: hypothetical protein OSB05_00755 [Akkermansiaceae bacterium]|nr:hypothetical protein [Akkermansiaceae bacterium]